MEFSPIFLQKNYINTSTRQPRISGETRAESNFRRYIYGADAGPEKSPESVTLLSALAF
jgi:hypothetical protein